MRIEQVIDTIRQREHALENAALSADTAKLSEICSQDFLFTHGNGNVQTRDEWFAAIETDPDYRFTQRTLSDLEIEVHGDVALSTARLDVVFTSGRRNAVKYARVYALRHDEWRLLTHRTVAVMPLDLEPA
jgi:hypothetical protein